MGAANDGGRRVKHSTLACCVTYKALPGPAITEIDSPNVRGGRDLITGPSRLVPAPSHCPRDMRIRWESTWESHGNMGIGLGFPGAGPRWLRVLSIPMNLIEVAPIYGNVTHYTNKHTSSTFNVFVPLPVLPH
jgi:hypothetical protein